MIEENAKVVSVTDSGVLVETQRATACGNCKAKSGCGTHTIENFLEKKNRNQFLVRQLFPVAIGDEVIIGLQESALLKGSLAVYIVPLVGFIGGGFFGELLSDQLSVINKEWFTIVTAGFGLMLGIVWLRLFNMSLKHRSEFEPILVRHANKIPIKT